MSQMAADILEIRNDHITLHVQMSGNMQSPLTIVLLHGLGQAKECFELQHVGPLLAYRLVAFDLRGHGHSFKPLHAEDYTGFQFALDIKNILAALSIQQCVLVGWALGACPVIQYLKYVGTGRLRGVVFISAVTEVNTPRFQRFANPKLVSLYQEMCSADLQARQRALERFVSNMTSSPLPPRAYDALLGYHAIVPPVAINQFFQWPAEDSLPILQQLKTNHFPVLVIQGEEDRFVPPRGFPAFVAEATGGRLLTYPSCGHMPFYERAERFNEDVSDFLEQMNAQEPESSKQ